MCYRYDHLMVADRVKRKIRHDPLASEVQDEDGNQRSYVANVRKTFILGTLWVQIDDG